jgi:hypothetical protein
MVEWWMFFVLKERFNEFKKGLKIFNPYKRLEIPTPNAKQ